MSRFLILICILLLVSCKVKNEHQGEKPLVVCSTSIIADCVKQIAGEDFEVVSLMGAGVDPHAYNPRPTDVEQLEKADVIVYNGLHLEGKMAGLFADLGKRSSVIAVADYFPKSHVILADKATGTADPHIWFATEDWLTALEGVTKELGKNYPEKKQALMKRFQAYKEQVLKQAAEWKRSIAEIPEQQRVLITSHDAFHYFGKEYSVKVKALQGVSTTQEPGVKDVIELVDFITENHIKALFIEHSVSPKSLQAVRESCKSKGHQVAIGGTLYSDALGSKGGKADTYTGMLQENISTICKGLK